MVFVVEDDNDDVVEYFGVDLVGFFEGGNGGDPSLILLPPILLFLVLFELFVLVLDEWM